MTSEKGPTPSSIARPTHLVLTGVIAISFVGFFVGIHTSAQSDGPLASVLRQAGQAPPAHTTSPDVVPSMTYAQMRENRLGPNAGFHSELSSLRPPGNDPSAWMGQDPQAKLASLAQRAERRAFNGAPPIIPHSIDQLSVSNCLACHDQGLRIAENVAHMPPHRAFTNCTQCHVEQSEGSPLSPNSFQGLPAPQAGQRAWMGAPPTIPHSLAMRSNCLSCHGRTGPPGMRTSHPERTSCLQCHAPSAHLNQAPTAEASAFLRILQGAGP